MVWTSWDATTQKDVTETLPNPRYAFRSTDNEVEGLMASLLTVKLFKGKIKTVANLGTDYSYGRNMWDTFMAMMKKYDMNVTPVADLWVKVGTTDLTTFVASLQQAKPDLINVLPVVHRCLHFHEAGACGGPHEKLKTGHAGCRVPAQRPQEGIHSGRHDPWTQLHVFRATQCDAVAQGICEPVSRENKLFPHFEAERAYSACESWKAGMEKAAKRMAANGRQGADRKSDGRNDHPSLGGYFSWRPDHIPDCNFYMGITTHNNPYDIVTIDPVYTLDTREYQKPAGADFYKWIETKNFKEL